MACLSVSISAVVAACASFIPLFLVDLFQIRPGEAAAGASSYHIGMFLTGVSWLFLEPRPNANPDPNPKPKPGFPFLEVGDSRSLHVHVS